MIELNLYNGGKVWVRNLSICAVGLDGYPTAHGVVYLPGQKLDVVEMPDEIMGKMDNGKEKRQKETA